MKIGSAGGVKYSVVTGRIPGKRQYEVTSVIVSLGLG